MPPVNRRSFLGSSLLGLTAAALSPIRAARAAADERSTAAEPAGLDSLFLTWQRDPTTTMTIQWIGPQADTGHTIRYRSAPDGPWSTATSNARPYPETDLNVHRCELEGLEPGTEYEFQVGEQRGVERFRTMPAKATDTIQFVSGGDAGIGSHAVGTNRLAAKQDPWFALLGGDLAYDNGTAPQTFTKFLQNYRQHMVDSRGRLIPMISCIGNHEVKGGYKGTRADAPHYLSVFDGLFADTTYGVLDVGDYLSIVLLDTGHIAPIGGEQTDWLARCLADRQDRPHLLVANHVPAYPSHRDFDEDGSGTGGENRRHWSPLFEKYNVDVVLEHHDHTFKRTHPMKGGLIDPAHGVLYLGDGSWGKLRAPRRPEERPYLAAVGEAYHVTVHRLEGDRRFHVALEESGKVADVCMTVSKRGPRRR